MDSAVGDEEAALSDFEEDDLEAAAVVLPASTNASCAESLKTALAELEVEKQARKAAEAAKADADVAAVRLKSYIHELIRQRDEASRQKDEALRGKDDRSKQLEEALQSKDNIIRQRDEIVLQRDEVLRQKEEIGRARDSARGEIERVARILVTQAEKIVTMASGVKSFPGGLPRVPKSTGLTAIALGFGKRVEEVVEEILKQREDAVKRRNELHIQMEQRNFSIAIEVSQLEASVTQLKEELAKKSSELERWQKLAAGKDGRIAEIEHAMLEQVGKTKQEAEILKQRVEEVEGKLQQVNSEIAQNAECTAKAKSHLLQILQPMDSEDPCVPSQSDMDITLHEDEPPQKEFSAEGHEIVNLASRVALFWKENQQSVERERKDFESTINLLREEKSDIPQKSGVNNGKVSLDDSELGMTDDADDDRKEGLGGVPELLNPTEDHKLVNEKILSDRDDHDALEDNIETYTLNGEVRQSTSQKLLPADVDEHENGDDQNVLKIALLEEEVKNLQQELERTANTTRVEIDRLQLLLGSQEKDLAVKVARILELEKHVKENVKSFTGELLAAEEDVTRWKEAATAEAAAGAAILEEVEMRNKQIAALNERLAEFREMVEEANSKISSKEEMAMAAIAARNAAERSLQIADERAADLRYRVEEMSRQLEDFEQRGDYRGRGLLDMCWPWLRGRGRPGFNRSGRQVQGAAEMEELLEPLV